VIAAAALLFIAGTIVAAAIVLMVRGRLSSQSAA
jgi:hypothetical protein